MQYSARPLITIIALSMVAGGAVLGAAPTIGSRRFVHPQTGYAITPPAGFKLRQVGRRTLWQAPGGAQLLVETAAASGSPRRSWERLSAALAQKYGRRYRLLNIRDARLRGHPVAVWTFEIDQTRKVDVGLSARGRGYAILVSAPRSRFRAWQPHFEAALRSFALPGAPLRSTRPPAAKPSKPSSPKPPVRKPSAAKPPVKKAPVKKVPVRKPPARKPPARKPPTPKPSPKPPPRPDDMIRGY